MEGLNYGTMEGLYNRETHYGTMLWQYTTEGLTNYYGGTNYGTMMCCYTIEGLTTALYGGTTMKGLNYDTMEGLYNGGTHYGTK